MHIEVELNFKEIKLAETIAKKRNQTHRVAKRRDTKATGDSIGIDRQGALAELAVAKAFDLNWDGKLFENLDEWEKWRKNDHDVQGLGVRSTNNPNYRLLLQKKDNDDIPFILVFTHKHPVYILYGWILAKDGKQDNFWWRGRHNKPCFYIPQKMLNPMNKLIGMKNIEGDKIALSKYGKMIESLK